MKSNLIIKKLFVYSEKNKKFFYTEFSDGVNIIYGKNTAGKSTVFQSIYYALGINDNNQYLKEILSEEVIVRLDFILFKRNNVLNMTFIRDDDTLLILENNKVKKVFTGINSNSSREHIKLKEYMHELFDFTLKLEKKREYTSAPIETIFLPYYISQSVGWVYLMKSFSNLEFYRNFRNDYLDYYLGVENYNDRLLKLELENKLDGVKRKLDFLEDFKKNNDKLQITKLSDECFVNKTKEYLDYYVKIQNELQKAQASYISKCNELSYYRNRQALLRKINNNHKNQNPLTGTCPMCNQPLAFTIESQYKFIQERNDTESELNKIKEKMKNIQSELNSLDIEIKKYTTKIERNYNILNEYENQNISFDSWLKNKSNTTLINELETDIGKLNTEITHLKKDLDNFKTDEEIRNIRRQKERTFLSIFSNYLSELKVKPLEGTQYKSLYKISAFPSQGVELHKTVLGYNFALNKLISKNLEIHRCPFLLDGIFKEDIEEDNKNVILKFIGKNKPIDTQLIFSVAEIKKNSDKILEYNEIYFNNKANIICIGDGCKERAFLQEYDNSIHDILNETELIINNYTL